MSETKQIKLTDEEQRAQNMAIFVAGQLLALFSQLNAKALDKFVQSDASNPEKGSDFRYREQCAIVVRAHKELFPER